MFKQIFIGVCVLIVLFSFSSNLLYSQKKEKKRSFPKEILKYDTISLSAGIVFISPTNYFIIPKDTTIIIKSLRKLHAAEINQLRTQSFYDSIYQKFNRNKIAKLLYNLAFVPPKVSNLSDTIQNQKIEVPFLPYQGMYISEVKIKILDPFGTSIFDTLRQTQTSAGTFGNRVHITTHKSVIRKQLMFKKGERVNAEQIADNLRILKDLSFLSNARFVLTETSPGSDTIAVTVITKDNWSIGGTFSVLDLTKYRGSIYDANFLGSGNRLSVNMSIYGDRAPSFRFDKISYNFTNIRGSFIHGYVYVSQDDIGNKKLFLSMSRPFYSYSTKFAGGFSFTLAKTVSELTDGRTQSGEYHQESGWLGRSSPIQKSDPATRFIISQGFLHRDFFSHPVITIDSNAGFYNRTDILTSIAVSKNKYYNTDYVLQFGKTESFPYGFLVQLTFGPTITNFYTRWYMNIGAAAGNFIEKFGYLSGELGLGGFLNREAFEDGLLKVSAQYMSYLYFSSSKRFKFRSFVGTEFIFAFNERTNYKAYFDLAEEFQIKKVNIDSLYLGNKALSVSFSTVAYPPWYFYGFRFAIQGTIQVGLAANRYKALSQSHLITGIGVSMMVKNDNLIFPTLKISCFVYPTAPGVPIIQFDMNEVSKTLRQNFAPTAPQIQTIQN